MSYPTTNLTASLLHVFTLTGKANITTDVSPAFADNSKFVGDADSNALFKNLMVWKGRKFLNVGIGRNS